MFVLAEGFSGLALDGGGLPGGSLADSASVCGEGARMPTARLMAYDGRRLRWQSLGSHP